MNLVAKEYVAAQDETDPGVLVLSRFAGAAEALEEALIVNPYDPDEVATAIQRAITMPKEERIERHRGLLKRVRANDARNWAASFLRALTLCEQQVPNDDPDEFEETLPNGFLAVDPLVSKVRTAAAEPSIKAP
jgi:trehalose-6-phosphate synthase